MKLLFTLLIGCVALGSAFSQVTVYETGQTYGDPWTGWSTPVVTNVSSSSVNGADVYVFTGTASNAYTVETYRQFTNNSNDIDIYFAATTQNATATVEYSTDNVSYSQIGTNTWAAGFSQGFITVATYDPVVTTFYIKLTMAGTFASPSQAQFNNLYINAVLNTGSSVSIAPATTQVIAPSTNGNVLTATETPSAATSREWKYSTTTGTGYVSFGTPETGLTYTPNFATVGTYYVICESDFSGTIEESNEVRITVSNSSSINESSISSAMKYYNNTLNVITDEVDYQISIFDLSGKLMLQENNLTTFQFSSLPKGVYIVNMTSATGEHTSIKVSRIE